MQQKLMEFRNRNKANPNGLLLVGLILVSFVSEVTSLAITVDDEECVYEYVHEDGDTVSGNFVAHYSKYFWGDDHPGIDFTASHYRGEVVHSVKGTGGEQFAFKAPHRGMYKFCFHNPTSTRETVNFHIHIGHIPSEHDIAKDGHLDPINVKIAELKEKLELFIVTQNYMKSLGASHRHTNESTRQRVIFYTVGEYFMLALASTLQVVCIRKLFSKTVAYGRV